MILWHRKAFAGRELHQWTKLNNGNKIKFSQFTPEIVRCLSSSCAQIDWILNEILGFSEI